MTADDRKRTILELLKTNGSVRVNELSSLFSISEVLFSFTNYNKFFPIGVFAICPSSTLITSC